MPTEVVTTEDTMVEESHRFQAGSPQEAPAVTVAPMLVSFAKI